MTSAVLATDRDSMPDTGQGVLRGLRTNEVFVAIVGPAGAGVGTAAKCLLPLFEDCGFIPVIIKVSTLIRKVATAQKLQVPASGIRRRKSLDNTQMMQDRGDEIRRGEIYGYDEDHSAVARLALKEIAEYRARQQGQNFSGEPIDPDGGPRAYIIDSLRHPEEANLLREVYKDAFALLGVVCDPVKREKRIRENFFDRSEWSSLEVRTQVSEFLDRDANADERYGQQVSDTFHKADYFVDNSRDGNEDLSETGMNKSLRRFVELITQNKIFRPTVSETAMHQAQSAQMRSACLSRQVGAALIDAQGNTVAIGTNDVPKAGGGLYGEIFIVDEDQNDESQGNDFRCAFRDNAHCSNTKEQNNIINELVESFPELQQESIQTVIQKIRKTRLGGLLEFSRAVHAEMDAILSASVTGISPRGCRLYVTTYPCHYCARHIVAAGIDEVQFIEPYPKSMAAELHGDSITSTFDDKWIPPSEGGGKVLFRPFVGVAPRLYRKVFLKDRSYKDGDTGSLSIGAPEWSNPTDVYKVAYPALEAELALGVENE